MTQSPQEKAALVAAALVDALFELGREPSADGKSELIKLMIDRFLGWKLPEHFRPDAGISFAPLPQKELWPTGTNLFDYDQAKTMFEYCFPDVQIGDFANALYIDKNCNGAWVVVASPRYKTADAAREECRRLIRLGTDGQIVKLTMEQAKLLLRGKTAGVMALEDAIDFASHGSPRPEAPANHTPPTPTDSRGRMSKEIAIPMEAAARICHMLAQYRKDRMHVGLGAEDSNAIRVLEAALSAKQSEKQN